MISAISVQNSVGKGVGSGVGCVVVGDLVTEGFLTGCLLCFFFFAFARHGLALRSRSTSSTSSAFVVEGRIRCVAGGRRGVRVVILQSTEDGSSKDAMPDHLESMVPINYFNFI